MHSLHQRKPILYQSVLGTIVFTEKAEENSRFVICNYHTCSMQISAPSKSFVARIHAHTSAFQCPLLTVNLRSPLVVEPALTLWVLAL